MKHSASHDLPISYGWSSYRGDDGIRVNVWCGRCKDYFTPDEQWTNRYYDSERRRYEGRGAFDPVEWRPYTDAENEQALEATERDRAHLLGLLAELCVAGGA